MVTVRVDELTQQLRARLKTIPVAKRALPGLRRIRNRLKPTETESHRLRFMPGGDGVAVPEGGVVLPGRVITVPPDSTPNGRFLRLSTQNPANAEDTRAYGRIVETARVDRAALHSQSFVDRFEPPLALLDARSDFASVADRANAILGAIACGVPVIVEDRAGLEAALPGELLDRLAALVGRGIGEL